MVRGREQPKRFPCIELLEILNPLIAMYGADKVKYLVDLLTAKTEQNTVPEHDLAGILEDLNHAFDGDAWHGPPLRKVLDGMTADVASARPVPNGHTNWETESRSRSTSSRTMSCRPLPRAMTW
jgi:hypothetical protein